MVAKLGLFAYESYIEYIRENLFHKGSRKPFWYFVDILGNTALYRYDRIRRCLYYNGLDYLAPKSIVQCVLDG